MASYYARPDQNLTLTAIAVTSDDADPEYPPENFLDENAAKPSKLTTTFGAWVFEFDDPVAPVLAALIYQYLDEDLDVRLQGNDSDSWGSPDFEASFTIPAKRYDGPSYQRWTVSPYMVLDGSPSYAFWRLVIVDANSQAVAVGGLFLASGYQALDLFVDQPMPEDDTAGEIVHPTELGVETIYDLGGPRRGITILRIASDQSAGTAPVQAAADFRRLSESLNGRQHPFLFIPFGTRNDAWLVRPESAIHARTHHVDGRQDWPLSLREVSRGLPWP